MVWQLIEVEGRLVPANENNESILTIVDEDGTKFAAVFDPKHAHMIAAAPAMLASLKLHIIYDDMPSDRGGRTGPKGAAWTAFVSARDAAIALAEATP